MTVFGLSTSIAIIVTHPTRTGASRRAARGKATPDDGPASSHSKMNPFVN